MAIYDFSKTLYVPAGRTYVVREFRFIPSRIIYNSDLNPFENFYQWSWKVSGVLQGDTVAIETPADSPINYFSGAGSLGFMEAFFIAPQFSVIAFSIQTMDIPDNESPGITINAIIDIRVDNLLNDSRPVNMQVGNRHDELELIRLQASANRG